MAVTKVKAYHSSSSIRNIIVYVKSEEKTKLEYHPDEEALDVLHNAIRYSENNIKTTYVAEDGHTEILVSGHHCSVELAEETFRQTADTYHRNGHDENAGRHYKVKTLLRAKLDKNGIPLLDEQGFMIHDEKAPVYHDENGDTITFMQERVSKARNCYMWVMSFPPPRVCGFEIDPRLVHQIGLEFMQELEAYQGCEFPAIVATHCDKEHVHNHVPMCAFSSSALRKYRDDMESLQAARDITDRLSLKYNLPIILAPENKKSMSHEEWELAQQGKSWKQALRDEIAYHLERSASFEDFKVRMKRNGYNLRETENHLTFYTPGNSHRCRDTNLGSAYIKEALISYFEPDSEKETQPSLEETLLLPSSNRRKTHTLYVSRYTVSGRRRSDLEMLLLKAIKIIKLIGDSFTEPDNSSTNPVYRSSSWKIERLSESISILHNRGISTAKELDEQLMSTGAALSHAKKDYNDLSQGKTGLSAMKDLLENLQELSNAVEQLGISDFYLHPPTQKEITEHRAKTFPMSSEQRRSLYIALQGHSHYKLTTKFDNLTFMEAKDCIDYLTGKSNTLPKVLATSFSSSSDLDRKYDAIAKKVLEGLRSRLQNKPISPALKRELSTYSIPINIDNLSMADAIHLASYYRKWNPNYRPCTNFEELVSSGKAMQLEELLKHHGLSINIPVEQLSRKDAGYLFQQLVLSRIIPDIIKQSLEDSWRNSISQLGYEDRCLAEEYRELLQQISLLGYDAMNTEPLLADVTAQLANIRSAEQTVNELKDEYKTLKQLKIYTTLADTSKSTAFCYGPNWKKQFQKEVEIKETNQPAEPEPEEVPQPTKRHFNVDVDIDI